MNLIEFIEAHPEIVEEARNRARIETAGLSTFNVKIVETKYFIGYLNGYRAAVNAQEKKMQTETPTPIPEKKLILSKEQRQAARKTWDTYIRMKVKDKPEHHLLYLILMNKDVRRAFAPVQNETKIEHLRVGGRAPDYKLTEACVKVMDRLTHKWAWLDKDTMKLTGVWYTDENAGRPGETVRHFHHLPEDADNALGFPNSPEITEAVRDAIKQLCS